MVGYLLAFLVPIIALPLVLFVLLRFGYRLFARPYLRLLRMRRYRNNRDLRDAANRGRCKVIVNPHRANSDPRPSPPEAER